MKVLKGFVLFCAAISVVACKKDDGDTGADEKKSLYITLQGPDVRSLDDPAAGGSKTEIGSMYVYLTDGVRVLQYDAVTEDEAVSEFSTLGKTYSDIPSTVSEVIIVANKKSADLLPVEIGSSVADIKNFAFGLEAQQPSSTNSQAKSVSMMSWSGLVDTGETTADGAKKMTSHVVLRPIVGRMEVKGNMLPGVGVGEIFVDQIWMNSYFPDGACSGDLVNGGSEIAAYADNLQNVFGNGSENLAAITTGGKVDAYHLFSKGENGVDMPHIVVRVSGKYTDGSAFSDMFITIKRYKTGATALTQFKPNNIYKIDLSALTVPASSIDKDPEAADIDLTVTVSVEAWQSHTVTPEID